MDKDVAARANLIEHALEVGGGPTPIWLMRQAGRYLPEYREVRAKAGSFLDLCYAPELAAEVTLQPVRRFDLDAAILFSDILVVPHVLGRRVNFVEGEGPRLDPIDVGDVDGLELDAVAIRAQPVFETVARVREGLASEKALIGFCGAPWTVATYMIAGRGTPDQSPARLVGAREPALVDRLIEKLVTASAEYLVGQLEAGADIVQIFDSWSGVLGEKEFIRWCVEPTTEIVRLVRDKSPNARIIGFPKGAGLMIERYAGQTGVDAVGLDWTLPLDFVRDKLQRKLGVQGNLDPMALVAGGEALDRRVDRIMAALAPGRFIFNLGHGIVPQTPIDHVERLVRRVRGWGG